MKDISIEENYHYRINVYDFLRRVYLWAFPFELFEIMINNSNKKDENKIYDYVQNINSSNLVDIYNDIKVEYTRLFVGPKKLLAPPYASVYLNNNGLLMQEETIKVRNIYLDESLQKININKEPDDHIGTQMEFMYLISNKILDALENKEYEEFNTLFQKQKFFCLEYMVSWIPLFCNDIASKTNNQFWKMIAEFTKQIVLEEINDFEAFNYISWKNDLLNNKKERILR